MSIGDMGGLGNLIAKLREDRGQIADTAYVKNGNETHVRRWKGKASRLRSVRKPILATPRQVQQRSRAVEVRRPVGQSSAIRRDN